MENSTPYIGVTGLTSKSEVEQVVSLFEEKKFSHYIPMLGFLVSYKTLNNIPTENKRYPKIEALPELLRVLEGKKVFPTIHYNSREPDLFNQISLIFNSRIYQENFCRGLQLNIPWPDLNELKVIKSVYPELKIIFQASKEVLSFGTAKEIASRIKSEYSSLIDYLLIDPSGGNGIPLNLENSCNLYQELSSKLPELIIGFAGGFSGENVFSRINSLEKTLGGLNFSLDAEGRFTR